MRRCVALLDTFQTELVFSSGVFELHRNLKADGVYEILIGDPRSKLNLLDDSYFNALQHVTNYLSKDLNREARCAILAPKEGHAFSAGLNLVTMVNKGMTSDVAKSPSKMPAMRLQEQHRLIRFFQDGVSSLARCRVPILCAIDGHCIGGGTSLATACDVRFATKRASFSVREAGVGLAADIGTLQRLPQIVGQGRARELCYTARFFDAEEAVSMGLVEDVFDTYHEMMTAVRMTAAGIAANSPLAVQGTKHMLNWQLEKDAQTSLEYMAAWNAFSLLCDDVAESGTAFVQKREPKFTNYMVEPRSVGPRGAMPPPAEPPGGETQPRS